MKLRLTIVKWCYIAIAIRPYSCWSDVARLASSGGRLLDARASFSESNARPESEYRSSEPRKCTPPVKYGHPRTGAPEPPGSPHMACRGACARNGSRATGGAGKAPAAHRIWRSPRARPERRGGRCPWPSGIAGAEGSQEVTAPRHKAYFSVFPPAYIILRLARLVSARPPLAAGDITN